MPCDNLPAVKADVKKRDRLTPEEKSADAISMNLDSLALSRLTTRPAVAVTHHERSETTEGHRRSLGNNLDDVVLVGSIRQSDEVGERALVSERQSGQILLGASLSRELLQRIVRIEEVSTVDREDAGVGVERSHWVLVWREVLASPHASSLALHHSRPSSCNRYTWYCSNKHTLQ